jgi:hypothetical protein
MEPAEQGVGADLSDPAYPAARLPAQHNQLMPGYRIFSFKPHRRLEG